MLVKLNVNEINKENDMKVYVTKTMFNNFIFYDTLEKAQTETQKYKETFIGTVDLDIIPEPKFKVGDWVKVKVWNQKTQIVSVKDNRKYILKGYGCEYLEKEFEPCEPPEKKWVKKEMNAWLEQTVDAQLPKGQQLKNIKLTYEQEVEE
jgi:hypothetical protein